MFNPFNPQGTDTTAIKKELNNLEKVLSRPNKGQGAQVVDRYNSLSGQLGSARQLAQKQQEQKVQPIFDLLPTWNADIFKRFVSKLPSNLQMPLWKMYMDKQKELNGQKAFDALTDKFKSTAGIK